MTAREDVLACSDRAAPELMAHAWPPDRVLVAGASLVVPCAEGQVLFNTGPVGATIGQ
jgi:hypothetical protein